MPAGVLLEICVASVNDAVAAVAAGAGRLELNSALSLGGLTPSAGLFAEVRRRVAVPVIAMIRPRPGGFCYSDTDFAVMLRDAAGLIAAGADGLAFGILTAGGEIDTKRCRTLRAACGPRDAVFHRAFDVTPDPVAALETLVSLGFTRVMTSGQAVSALEGADLIARLNRQSAGRIEVLSAGGIKPATAASLMARTGCRQVHAAVRTTGHDPSATLRPHVRFSTAPPPTESQFDQTDPSAVAALRRALDQPVADC